MNVFFDESGNSGTDVYDPNQPVLAYAGAWLNPADGAHFRSYLTSLRARHQLQGSGELKGQVLVNSARGRHAVADVLRELGSRRVPISLIGVYKPYFGPGVLVDDCTDDAYNPAFDESWTWNTNATIPLIESIPDNADPSLLIAAWRARDGDDLAAMKTAYSALLTSLAQSQNRELAAMATRMARTDFDRLWACSEITRRRGMEYSPNLSAFSSMLQGCEEQAEQLGYRDVEILHDDQGEFRDSFAYWWGALRANPRSNERFVYPTGNEQRFSLKRLSKLTFVDSQSETGVQLADVLASAMRVAMHECTMDQGSRATDFIAELRHLCAARERLGTFPFFIGTYRWQRKMLAMLQLEPNWSLDQ